MPGEKHDTSGGDNEEEEEEKEERRKENTAVGVTVIEQGACVVSRRRSAEAATVSAKVRRLGRKTVTVRRRAESKSAELRQGAVVRKRHVEIRL